MGVWGRGGLCGRKTGSGMGKVKVPDEPVGLFRARPAVGFVAGLSGVPLFGKTKIRGVWAPRSAGLLQGRGGHPWIFLGKRPGALGSPSLGSYWLCLRITTG